MVYKPGKAELCLLAFMLYLPSLNLMGTNLRVSTVRVLGGVVIVLI